MSNLKPLKDQIAGHTEEDGGSQNIPPFLKSDEGYVFKPVPNARGQKELDFYKSLNNFDKTLIEFVPRYIRTEYVNNIPYIGIEDLTHGYKDDFVNVADIKMGTRTYDKDASAEKIKLENEKSSKTTTKSLGIRFCGAKVVHPTSGEKQRFSKVWGKKLKDDQIYQDAIKTFFWHNDRNQIENELIVKSYLAKLNQLLEFFTRNEQFAFYSSSLLFVYGPVANNTTTTINTNNSHISLISNDSKIGISLKMIDFAHVDPITPPEKDEGYIFGLKNLISFLNKLLESN